MKQPWYRQTTFNTRLYLHLLLMMLAIAPSDALPQTQRITIPRNVIARQPNQDGVTARLSKSVVTVGEQVTIQAHYTGSAVRRFYSFEFGDGTSGEQRLRDSSCVHTYRREGSYRVAVIVENGIGERSASVNDTIAITVLPIPLNVNPVSAVVDSLVTFEVRWFRPAAYIRYRLSYGDGDTSEWRPGSTFRHRYTKRGMYSAQAEIGIERVMNVDSSQQQPYKSESKTIRVISRTVPAGDTIHPSTPESSRSTPPVVLPVKSKNNSNGSYLPWLIATVLLIYVLVRVRKSYSTRSTKTNPGKNIPTIRLTIDPRTELTQIGSNKEIGVTIRVSLQRDTGEVAFRTENQQALITDKRTTDA